MGARGTIGVLAGTPPAETAIKEETTGAAAVFGDCAGAIWGYRSDGMGSMRVGR